MALIILIELREDAPVLWTLERMLVKTREIRKRAGRRFDQLGRNNAA